MSSYYFDMERLLKNEKSRWQRIYSDIGHAMKRLDELWDGNDFKI